MSLSFPKFFETLDADEPVGKTYTFRLQVAAGDSITSAALAVVDPTSTTIQSSPLITVTGQTLGFIQTQLYSMTFRAQGTGAPGNAYVRCRYTTALGNGDDVTYIVVVTQR